MQQGTWNRNRDAIKAFDKAIEIKPQYADAWNNKGMHSKSTFLTPLPAVPLIQKGKNVVIGSLTGLGYAINLPKLSCRFDAFYLSNR